MLSLRSAGQDLGACRNAGVRDAAARVLLLMSHNSLAYGGLRATHQHNETPGHAIIVAGAAGLPVAVLAARGAGWMCMGG